MIFAALYVLSILITIPALIYVFVKNPRWGYGSYARLKTNGDIVLSIFAAFIPVFNIFMTVHVLDQEHVFSGLKGFWDRPVSKDE